MTDEDDPIEVSSPALTVPETHRLFRLAQAAVDYLKPSIQTALVPADNEDDARRIATETDPMGQDWRDQTRFVADSIVTPESHVVGDVVFKSVLTGARFLKSKRIVMGKKNETLEWWATDLLLEAHAITPCPDHGYMRLRHSHHAVEYACDLAKHRKFSGKNKKERVAAVEEVLDGLGDTCPGCD